MPQAILVFGATGKQGGAVIDALLAEDSDFELLAVSRNLESPSAQRLVRKSSKIKLVGGDGDNVKDVFQKAKQIATSAIYGVFSVQPIDHSKPETEERLGKSLIDAAVESRVKHIVYSSVDRGGDSSSDTPTNVPHFKTKHHIEQHLFQTTRGTDTTYTVLRPTAFFENLTPGFVGRLFSTSFDAMLEGKRLQMIATSDIGVFAAYAFSNPDEYRARCISLAGDELTFAQFRTIFEARTGRRLPTMYRFVTHTCLWLVQDIKLMFTWFRTDGYGADIARLREVCPTLKDFGTWLETESWWQSVQDSTAGVNGCEHIIPASL